MSGRVLGIGGLLVALVALFAVNVIGGTWLGAARIDLTENRLYTLSDGTRAILGDIDEPITLKLYVSQRLATRIPSIKGYVDRVRQLLGEYQRMSDGKLRVQIIDPEPFSEEEDRAVGLGIRGVPLNEGEETLYFGLVGTGSTDEQEVIPYLSSSRAQFLEYDVTKLVHNLARPERKVVGLLSTIGIDGMAPTQGMMPGQGMSPPWVVVDQMRQLFEVRSLGDQIDAVPGDVDVLMIVHPREFGDGTRYAIDQFVLGGGRAVVFVDPHSDAQTVTSFGVMNTDPDRSSGLPDLFRAWGVELEDDAVVSDLASAVPVRMERDGRLVTFDYPVWLDLQPEQFDPDDIVTSDLGNLSMGTAGSLRAVEGATTRFVPLVSSSPDAMKVTTDKVSVGANPQELLQDYAPGGAPLVTVARVSGPVVSAFPDGPPPAKDPDGTPAGEVKPSDAAKRDDGNAPGTHLDASSEDVQLVIIADTDMLQDRFWVQTQDFLGTRIAIPTAANGTLVVNALDNLLGSGDLISVRNRGSFVRPFERIEQLRQEAESVYREKEEALVARLEETERKLLELDEGNQGEEGIILSDAQREELVEFRKERLRVRKELRDVRRGLRSSIERLEGWIKFANIGLVPILIGLFGIAAGLWQLRRRRRGTVAPA